MKTSLMHVSTAILAMILLPVLPVSTQTTETVPEMKRRNLKGMKKRTFYSPVLFPGQEPGKVITVTAPLYGEKSTEDDPIGNFYLVAVVYNFEEEGEPGYVPVNDNKITLNFEDGSGIVADGVYDTGAIGGPLQAFAIIGGVGKYKNARGELLASNDGSWVTFVF